MRKYTNSELTTFKTCRRQWWLKYYRRLAVAYDGPEVSAAGLGTLVHLGLQYHHDGQDGTAGVRARIAIDRAELVETGAEHRLKKFDQQSALAVVMLEGYFEWLEESGADADLEFIAAEQAVEIPVAGGISLLGKLDAKVRLRSTGEVRFMDNKTVQSIDGTIESAYRSTQFRHYAVLQAGLLKAGTLDTPQAGGVILNMLRKVGRGASSKPPYYGRHSFSFNETLVASHWRQVLAEIDRIEDTRWELTAGGDHQRLAPPNPSRDCSWRCEFKTICPMFDDGSDVETVISWGFRTEDPLARYETEEKLGSE